MVTNLAANKELQNYSLEDAFDFKIKADAITGFLEHNVESLLHNKMIALFGDWGSGKTSLMRHIEASINREIYYPVFFEAWSHEKDENLALSLCDLLTHHLNKNNEGFIQDFQQSAIKVLRGFTSALSVKVGGPWAGSEISFDGGKLIERLDESNEKKLNSFFDENKRFRELFLKIEGAILTQTGASRILVFVDDLDRCEPENVLNLITALKLFFTYGAHTIFFSGLDRDAVTKAVKTKYQDVVKSDEYLEKVFDITFGMPKSYSLQRYLSDFFYMKHSNLNTLELDNINLLEDLFRSIGFTNPRHIKKILNKYELLCAFKNSDTIPQYVRQLIPELTFRTRQGKLWESLLCLFFIILYENFPQQFEQIELYELKLKRYLSVFYNEAKKTNSSYSYATASQVIYGSTIIEYRTISLDMFFDSHNKPSGASRRFSNFVLLFANPDPERFTIFQDDRIGEFGDYFLDNGVLTRFCKFLIKNKEKIEFAEYSTFQLWNYFSMAKYLL